MNGIILAAGTGRRFFTKMLEKRPLHGDMEYPVPKTLFPVCDPRKNGPPEPVIDTLISSMLKCDIEEIFIGAGHEHGKLRKHVVSKWDGKPVHVVEPDEGIDYKKGPLFTLATVLQFLMREGVLERKGVDKIFLLAPGDLIIDQRAVWKITGLSGRGMMASRAMLHVIVDERDRGLAQGGARLDKLIPGRFQSSFSQRLLAAPVVPLMGIHIDLLIHAVKKINEGYTKLGDTIGTWLDSEMKDERELSATLNLIKGSQIGSKFYWHDMDTPEALGTFERGEA